MPKNVLVEVRAHQGFYDDAFCKLTYYFTYRALGVNVCKSNAYQTYMLYNRK